MALGSIRRWDGSFDYFRVPDVGREWVRNKTGITVAWWQKYYTGTGLDYIWRIYSETTSDTWFECYLNSIGSSMEISARRVLADSKSFATDSSINYRNSSVWYRMVAVVDFTAQSATIYRDGAQVATVSPGNLTAGLSEDIPSAKIEIGFQGTTCIGAYMFNFQFWDAPWDLDDVEWDYYHSDKLAYARPGTSLTGANLQMLYRFNEPLIVTSTRIQDYSGNGYHSYLTGGLRNGTTIVSGVTLPVTSSSAEAAMGIPAMVMRSTDIPDVTAAIATTIPALGMSAEADVGGGSGILTGSLGELAMSMAAEVATTATATMGIPAMTFHLTDRTLTTRLGVFKGLSEIHRSGVLDSFSPIRISRRATLRSGFQNSMERDGVLIGRHSLERNSVLKIRGYIGSRLVFRGETGSNPVVEQDLVKLRSSSVFSEPATLFRLQVVYGDYSTGNLSVPLKQIDKDDNIWLIADHTIDSVTGVLKDGSAMTAGWTYIPNYIDPLGNTISVIRFNTIQSGVMSVQCKGKAFSNGVLIDNPADIITDFLESVQKYSTEYIDFVSLGIFRSKCLTEGIKFRMVLSDQTQTVKSILTNIALNTNSIHTTNRGAHGMHKRDGFL